MRRRSKFILATMLAVLLCTLIFGYVAYQAVKSAHIETAKTELVTIRALKAAQITDYFADRLDKLQIITADERIISAMADLGQGFSNLRGREPLPDNVSSRVRQHYERVILPALQKKLGTERVSYETYGPKRRAQQYLQYQYVIYPDMHANLNTLTFSDGRAESIIVTDYQRAHATHENALSALADTLAAANLMLIDHVNGDIIYASRPGLDLGMNIYKSPFASEALIEVIEAIKADPIMRRLRVSDMDIYIPSDDGTALFMGAPIVEDGILIGVLAAEITSTNLTNVLSGDQWSDLGLGETGELYLVGEDYHMRTNTRSAAEDVMVYIDRLKEQGVEPSMINQIRRQGSTALAQEITTKDVAQALAAGPGLTNARDYRGAWVWAAATPLKLHGLNWILVVKKDSAEIFAPAHDYARKFTIISVIVILIIWLLARLLAANIMKVKKEPVASEGLLKSTHELLDAMEDPKS